MLAGSASHYRRAGYSLRRRRWRFCGLQACRRLRWPSVIWTLLLMTFFPGFLQIVTLNLSDNNMEVDLVGGDVGVNKRRITSLRIKSTRKYRNETLRPRVESPLSWDRLERRGPSDPSVNCQALIRGDTSEIQQARRYMNEASSKFISHSNYMSLTRDCHTFRTKRGYVMEPLSQEEANFPLAFSILMYKDVFQVERLLRAIYMPQNYYCIHVDAKASGSIHQTMRSITNCFPNVFMASRLYPTYWGHISIVKADLGCMQDLRKYEWKYYINLSGQMFPLQSNRNIVKILTLYNGANDVEGSSQRNSFFSFKLRSVISWRLNAQLGSMLPKPIPKVAPPHNLTLYKGNNQVAISRAFCNFVLEDQHSKDLLAWLEDTLVPDEYYIPTLNHNLQLYAPGGFRGNPDSKVSIARASLWAAWSKQLDMSWKPWECQGQWVRSICILGVGDLPWTRDRPELFVNKFYYDFEPLALDCLEELIFNRTMAKDKLPFDSSYYKRISIIKQRQLVNLVGSPG